MKLLQPRTGKPYDVTVSNVDLLDLCNDLLDARKELEKQKPMLESSRPMFYFGDKVWQASKDGKTMYIFDNHTGELLKQINEIRKQ